MGGNDPRPLGVHNAGRPRSLGPELVEGVGGGVLVRIVTPALLSRMMQDPPRSARQGARARVAGVGGVSRPILSATTGAVVAGTIPEVPLGRSRVAIYQPVKLRRRGVTQSSLPRLHVATTAGSAYHFSLRSANHRAVECTIGISSTSARGILAPQLPLDGGLHDHTGRRSTAERVAGGCQPEALLRRRSARV